MNLGYLLDIKHPQVSVGCEKLLDIFQVLFFTKSNSGVGFHGDFHWSFHRWWIKGCIQVAMPGLNATPFLGQINTPGDSPCGETWGMNMFFSWGFMGKGD
jgi:hypothetical protein